MQRTYRTVGMMVLVMILPHICQAEFGWNSVEIHGFLSQGYLKSSENNVFAETLDGTFQFNEVGLNFSTNLTDRLHVGLQLFSRDLGDFDNNDVELDWAYADFRWRDWLGFRAGRIKSASGLHMETADLDMLRTFIFLPQSIYNDSMRDIFIAVNGIGVYGYLPLASLGDVTYQFQYGETGIETDGTMALYMESEANARLIKAESSPVVRAHLEWFPPLEGVRLTGSVSMLDIDLRYVTTEQTYWAVQNNIPVGWEFPHRMENTLVLGGGIEFGREKLLLSAEYEYLETDVTRSGGDIGLYQSAGYYASITYRLTDWCELGSYYSVYYDDLDDRDGDQWAAAGQPRHLAWQKDWTVTLRLDMNDQWLIKGEVHLIDGTALMLSQHNPEGTERESVLVAIKTTYNF